MENSLALKVARTSRNLSRLLRVMTLLGALAGVAVLAGSVVMPELGKNWIRGAYPAVANITDGQVVLLALIAVLQLALTMVALWWLARMFDCVSGDEPLNLDAASAMRRGRELGASDASGGRMSTRPRRVSGRAGLGPGVPPPVVPPVRPPFRPAWISRVAAIGS